MYAELKLSPARPDAREQWYLSIDPRQKRFGVYMSRATRPTFPEPFATENIIPCGEQSFASNTTTETKQHNARTALVSCFGGCRRRLLITGTKQGTSRRTGAQTAHVEPHKTHHFYLMGENLKRDLKNTPIPRYLLNHASNNDDATTIATRTPFSLVVSCLCRVLAAISALA